MEGEIIFNIDVMLAKRKMSVTELSQRVGCLLYTSPSPRDAHESRMPSSA